MKTSLLIDTSTVAIGIITLLCLFSKTIRNSSTWNATVTPLASIIGSGFLIVAPLLWMLAGTLSNWVLISILIVAYGIGEVIRYNIQYTEPLLEKSRTDRKFQILNDVSYITLGLSYFISVTFYIRILSAFLLKFMNIEDAFLANLLTTVILLFIGTIGYLRGFDRLELMEVISVNIKISIILMLILGLFLYDWLEIDFHFLTSAKSTHLDGTTLRKILGVLIIVQGFEISRYIGNKYSAQMRIKTMRFAQILSAIIYLTFTFLILFIMESDLNVTETAIIDLTKKVSRLLPYAVMIGAIFSQFSAAIADTVGCGGIITEYSQGKISQKAAYLGITILCIGIVWSADVFQIIALASRLFAAYYFTQCLQAIYVNLYYQHKPKTWTAYFAIMSLLMLATTIFGTS